MLWTLILFLSNTALAEPEFNPEWFKCKSFSNCEKVTGNVCDRAVAVNSRFVDEYINYTNELNKDKKCSVISTQQIQEDLKKFPTCREGKCELIIPKAKIKGKNKAKAESKDVVIDFNNLPQEQIDEVEKIIEKNNQNNLNP